MKFETEDAFDGEGMHEREREEKEGINSFASIV
jgi:hypothetical protein